MTLLESIVAMVILSVVAVACLEGSRGAARLEERAGAVAVATAQAESELARAMVGQPVNDGVIVRRTPYPGADGLDLLEVEVAGVRGPAVKLARLVSRDGVR